MRQVFKNRRSADLRVLYPLVVGIRLTPSQLSFYLLAFRLAKIEKSEKEGRFASFKHSAHVY